METIFLRDIKNHVDEIVRVRGWVRNFRDAGAKLRFIIIRDGSDEVQSVAYKGDMSEDAFARAQQVTIETSLEVIGTVRRHPKQENVFELALSDLTIMQIAEDYPIGKKDHGADFLLSQRHLWIRSRKQWALLRIRHAVYFAICDFLNSSGFVRFDSPILTPNACEGTTTLFTVPYFDLGNAYLSQSGQLYLETGIMSLGRVYDFGPVFRAEKSKTRKHLTEFWMMDAEAAFVEHEENMQIQEDMIRHVIRSIVRDYRPELEILERDVDALIRADAPFKRISHYDAVEYLHSKGSEISHEDDLGAQDETWLTEDSAVPVFVERWPRKIKAFYMKRDPENPEVVLGSDLIAPEGFGEIIGGAQREDNYDVLLERMKEENMPIDEYQWYLDMRKYGSVPHSGFGIGLERTVAWISGVHHIRETIPFPRMIYRIEP